MTYTALIALSAVVVLLYRNRALQAKADTRATMRQIRRRHAAGVRGWQTRRAGV